MLSAMPSASFSTFHWVSRLMCMLFFFFNDTATPEIYTLSLHDALPISRRGRQHPEHQELERQRDHHRGERSEEHTSELQSRRDLVCRLLLEKKKNNRQSERHKKRRTTKDR